MGAPAGTSLTPAPTGPGAELDGAPAVPAKKSRAVEKSSGRLRTKWAFTNAEEEDPDVAHGSRRPTSRTTITCRRVIDAGMSRKRRPHYLMSRAARDQQAG